MWSVLSGSLALLFGFLAWYFLECCRRQEEVIENQELELELARKERDAAKREKDEAWVPIDALKKDIEKKSRKIETLEDVLRQKNDWIDCLENKKKEVERTLHFTKQELRRNILAERQRQLTEMGLPLTPQTAIRGNALRILGSTETVPTPFGALDSPWSTSTQGPQQEEGQASSGRPTAQAQHGDFELHQARIQVLSIKAEADTLRGQLLEAQDATAQQEAEAENLQARLLEAQNAAAQQEAAAGVLQEKLREAQDAVAQYETEVNSLHEELNETKNDVARLKYKAAGLSKELEEKSHEAARLEEDLRKAEKDASALRAEVDMLQTSKEEVKAQLVIVTRKLSSQEVCSQVMSDEITSLQDDKTRLCSTLLDLNSRFAKFWSIGVPRLEAFGSSLDDVSRLVGKLVEALEDRNNELNHVARECSRYVGRTGDVTASRLVASVVEMMDVKCDELEALKTKTAELHEELHVVHADNARLRSEQSEVNTQSWTFVPLPERSSSSE
ncbi:hypothetical protein Vafri_1393 [Volvox africanus]|nr:hypothetical protein Vafri_1393 [Volvox africanus]